MFINPDKLFNQENRVLFLDKRRSIDLLQFKSDVLRYTRYFQKLEDNEVVLYIKEDSYLFYLCFLACLYSNKHIILPGSISASSNFFPSSIKTVISNQNIKNITSSFKLNLINPLDLDSNLDQDSSCTFPMDFRGDFSFFTSGSTSTPKRIIKNIRHLCNEIENIYSTQQNNRSKESVFISSVEPYHTYGILWWFLYPLRASLCSWIDICSFEEQLASLCQRFTDIIFITTPTFLDSLSSDFSKKHNTSSIRTIYTSGSLLTKRVSEKALSLLGRSPIEIYGSTETGGIASRQQSISSFWTCFPPVSIDINEDSLLKVKSSFINTDDSSFQMMDKVELLSSSTFNLLGRADRLVKIHEKRISLPEMESVYEKHSFIKKAYLTLLKENTLGVLLTLSDEGNLFLKENDRSKFNLKLRTYLLDYYSSSSLPKKTLITFNFPYNAQGKLQSSELLSMFASKIEEPVVENLRIGEEEFSMNLTFLNSSTYFKGHFPSFPILPGVVQLHFAFYFIKRIFVIDIINSHTIKKLKFMNLVFPSKTITLEVKKNNNNSYTFKYFNGETSYSQGEIFY